jgi:hypothetical protein
MPLSPSFFSGVLCTNGDRYRSPVGNSSRKSISIWGSRCQAVMTKATVWDESSEKCIYRLKFMSLRAKIQATYL